MDGHPCVKGVAIDAQGLEAMLEKTTRDLIRNEEHPGRGGIMWNCSCGTNGEAKIHHA